MAELVFEFDIVVVGAGHAGVEAVLAASRMGLRTALAFPAGLRPFACGQHAAKPHHFCLRTKPVLTLCCPL
jgi:hypothetical protein